MYSTAQPQFLLYAGRRFIRRISLGDNRETTIPLGSGLQNVIALDYDYAQNCIYWADITLDTIKRSFLNGSGRLKQNCAKLEWGRRSCESARLPELWPRFDSWIWCLLLVLVLAPRKKTTFQIPISPGNNGKEVPSWWNIFCIIYIIIITITQKAHSFVAGMLMLQYQPYINLQCP